MSKFAPIYIVGGKTSARQAGWYIQDVHRSTIHALVIVGNRHLTESSAQAAADVITKF